MCYITPSSCAPPTAPICWSSNPEVILLLAPCRKTLSYAITKPKCRMHTGQSCSLQLPFITPVKVVRVGRLCFEGRLADVGFCIAPCASELGRVQPIAVLFLLDQTA